MSAEPLQNKQHPPVRLLVTRLPPTIAWFLVALTVVTAWGLLDPGHTRQSLDWYLQDQMLQNRTPLHLHEDVLLVLEDDTSASLLGKTDERHRRARALRQLARLGARTVLFDYLLLDKASEVSFIEDEALYDGLPASTLRADPDQEWEPLYTEDELQKSALQQLLRPESEDRLRPRTVIPFVFRQRPGDNPLTREMAEILTRQSPTPTAAELAGTLELPESRIRIRYADALEQAAEQLSRSRETVIAVMNDPERAPLQWNVKYHRERQSMLEQLTAEDSFPTRAIRSSLDDGHLQLPLADLTGFAALGFAEAREDRDDTLRRLRLTRDWLPAADVVDGHRVLIHQSLAAFLLFRKQRVAGLTRDSEGHRLIIPGAPATHVPLDHREQMIINWHVKDGRRWRQRLERSRQQVLLSDLLNLASYDVEINQNRMLVREVVVRLDEELQLGLDSARADAAIVDAYLQDQDPAEPLEAFHGRLVTRFLEHARIQGLLEATRGDPPPPGSTASELQLLLQWRDYIRKRSADRDQDERELRARVQDKLCLVGQVSTGSTDFKSTPVGRLPGILVNAAAVNTLLTRRFLLSTSIGWTLLVTTLVMTIVAVLFIRLNVVLSTLTVIPLLLLVAAAHFVTLEWGGRLSNPVLPLAGVLACFVSITTRRWWQDNQERRRVRQAFEFYLHPTVVEKVSEHPEALQLGGAATDLSILFSDIRSFTSIAERLRDEELTRLLNEYLSSMTDVVFDNSGTVDKYIGDAIMAFYGAPIASEIHPRQACLTALQMSQRLEELRLEWRQQGLPSVRIGVGINTDTVRVGNFGSAVRFDYTVIGDGVNLASRLEGANKQYGTEILISESTWERVRDDFATRELDLIQVKGRQRPTRIFELLAERPLAKQLASRIERFESALAYYREQDFTTAKETFEDLDDEQPGDSPVEMYIDRCTHFLQAPPGADWDGVFTMTTK